MFCRTLEKVAQSSCQNRLIYIDNYLTYNFFMEVYMSKEIKIIEQLLEYERLKANHQLSAIPPELLAVRKQYRFTSESKALLANNKNRKGLMHHWIVDGIYPSIEELRYEKPKGQGPLAQRTSAKDYGQRFEATSKRTFTLSPQAMEIYRLLPQRMGPTVINNYLQALLELDGIIPIGHYKRNSALAGVARVGDEAIKRLLKRQSLSLRLSDPAIEYLLRLPPEISHTAIIEDFCSIYLLSLIDWAEKQGGSQRLVELTPQEVLETITKINNLFKISDLKLLDKPREIRSSSRKNK